MTSFHAYGNGAAIYCLFSYLKAMENYTHATEYHLQGEKFAKAMNSAKQAELLAVQLSKVKEVPLNETTVCFLNLNSIQIANLIATNRSLR